VTGSADDQELIDLAALTDDQRTGLACVNCGTSRGAMRPMATPGRPRSAQLVVHVDIGVCVRTIARDLTGLYVRLLDAAEHTAAVLAQVHDASDP
jgi:hypothetical protein